MGTQNSTYKWESILDSKYMLSESQLPLLKVKLNKY